jgi:phosphotransferase system HPr-like phosphotransfer protein
MKSFSIQLNSINDVKRFVNNACLQPFDIDIVSGRYIVDAKSIMGIFSLDLSKPITVQVHGTEDDGRLFYDSVKDCAE